MICTLYPPQWALLYCELSQQKSYPGHKQDAPLSLVVDSMSLAVIVLKFCDNLSSPASCVLF